jgi:hypothetical protein
VKIKIAFILCNKYFLGGGVKIRKIRDTYCAFTQDLQRNELYPNLARGSGYLPWDFLYLSELQVNKQETGLCCTLWEVSMEEFAFMHQREYDLTILGPRANSNAALGSTESGQAIGLSVPDKAAMIPNEMSAMSDGLLE